MKSKIFIIILFISFFCVGRSFSQKTTDIFLIDSYVTPELPYKFVISFFTGDSVTSKVLIDNKYTFQISSEFTDNHKNEIDFSEIKFDSSNTFFVIEVTFPSGERLYSEKYDLLIPFLVKEKFIESQNIILMCCTGGTVLGFPSPSYVRMEGKDHFGLSKEIPFISFTKSNSLKPLGALTLEYSHIFDAPKKNFLRLAYKQFFYLPILEYISPGVGVFTNFKGYNGISPEFSLGLFKLYDVFNVFIKYRYNFQPSGTESHFSDLSLGLYSNFFTFHL